MSNDRRDVDSRDDPKVSPALPPPIGPIGPTPITTGAPMRSLVSTTVAFVQVLLGSRASTKLPRWRDCRHCSTCWPDLVLDIRTTRAKQHGHQQEGLHAYIVARTQKHTSLTLHTSQPTVVSSKIHYDLAGSCRCYIPGLKSGADNEDNDGTRGNKHLHQVLQAGP